MADERIPDVSFSDNTQQRTPCALVLDGSGSMEGRPIVELNAGLEVLEDQLKENPLTALRVQLLVIRVGDRDKASVICDWCDAIDFRAPSINANGSTPLGRGVALALERIEAQKAAYDRNGISSTRPWLMIVSDGQPNDRGWESVASQCREMEAARKVVVFPIGTSHADMQALARFSGSPPRKLRGLDFRDLFLWLSRSMSIVSGATPGQRLELPSTNWSEVEA